MLIHNKDDIEFVTEFPCFLGHPVDYIKQIRSKSENNDIPEESEKLKFTPII